MPEVKKRRISPAVAIIPIGIGLALIGVLAATAWAAPPTPPPGQANLYGKVTDSVTGEAISGVLVTLNGMQIYTDTGGNYTFANLEPGAYTLTFQKEGYQPAVF